MKPLFLLLILSPVILLAQPRRMDAIDANKEVTGINYVQSIPGSMGNDQCTRASDIRITDNGEYLTIVVFRHIITALDSAGEVSAADSHVSEADAITALPPVAVVKLNSTVIPVSKADKVATLPPLPVAQAGTITTLPIVRLPVADIPF